MRIICHGLKDEDFPVEFTDHKVMIGRDESNNLEVVADGVSRFHAILSEEGDDLFIQDNDSLNGTFLNYKQLSGKLKIVHGDIIQVGYRLIRVDFHSDEEVVLDFIPPEQTQIVSHDPTTPPLSIAVPDEPEQVLQKDNIDRTMVASETLLASTSSSIGIFASGSEIGKYIIIKRLGKGGMGEVYLAKHKTLGIFRALKMLSQDSDNSNAMFLERFIREAKLASEIRHPNVVGVMDVETDSECGFPYIVMEYVDGGSLRNSLSANRRLSEEQAVVIVEAVAAALQAAEEHNIVHRDIKPDNIMFTRRGEVKLADLGIAKVDGQNTDLTKTNVMIGTPAYLPPEQARNAKGVDARADIYSLGATFYEMLTGEQPYPGENSIEVLHKLFLTPVPDPRKINPEVSAASAAIVMKMMAKDPKNRFQNATELLTMMERTFPPHTPNESSKLIQKVIAGDCQNNTTFSSNISLSHLSLLWLKIPHKGFVFSVISLILACCIVSSLFLFLSKKPVASFLPDSGLTGNTSSEAPTDSGTGTPPVGTEAADETTKTETDSNTGNEDSSGTTAGIPSDQALSGPSTIKKSEYRVMIKTTPDAEITFTDSEGQVQGKAKVDQAYTGTTVKTPGKYTVTISKEYYQSISRVIEVNDDVTIDLPLTPGGPLVVTTDKDVINANDGVNSLREAFSYVRSLDDGNQKIIFSDDFDIQLSSSLTVAKNITIDGEDHNVTIIGPKTGPVFRHQNGSLNLKNISLISDNSNGILDPSFFDVKLSSVKDGGKSKYLWQIPVYKMDLDQGTHLHRIQTTKGSNPTVMIQSGTVLEDLNTTDNVTETNPRWRDVIQYLVYGLMKDASIQESRVFVYKGGTCENLSVRNGLIEHCDGGTINGLNIEIGTLYGYEPNAVLTGTVTVGGMMLEPVGRSDDHSIVGSKTDLIFDLTDRTEDTAFNVDGSSVEGTKYDYAVSHCDYLIQNMKAFSGARNYTVRVRQNQPSGSYKLAGNAAGFNTKVTLEVSDTSILNDSQSHPDVYSKALSIGKSYQAGNKVYVLHLTKDNMLTFTIRTATTDNRSSTGTGGTAVQANSNSSDKLQGALYLLSSQVSSRSSVLSSGGKKSSCFDVLKKFTLGSWASSTNAKGEMYYPELEQSFKRQATPALSYFCQDTVSWERGAELFNCRDTVEDAGWVAVYSGYVVAPFTGRFRFLGYCDDMMVVRFNRQIVIDYGNRSLTAGLPLLPDHGLALHSLETGERVDYGTDSLYTIVTSNPVSREEKRMLSESPLYSKNQIIVTRSSVFGSDGTGPLLVASPELSIRKGQVIPIDILIGEMHKEEFKMFLLIERLSSSNDQTVSAPQSTFLFRTTSAMPGKTEDPKDKLSGINQDAPIWKVVDSRGNPIPPKRTQK